MAPSTQPPRIYLSPPHMGGQEEAFVREAFETNWIAPVGPHITGFEQELAATVGSPHAVALSSGTAGLHLALILCGVGPGDEVFVSDLTFVASVNPIRYQGATPVLIDSESTSWNMDPALLAEALEDRARAGRLPRAVMLVHLYGQSADLDPIATACARYDVPLIEDAAEALGATYKGQAPGTRGVMGVYSFNGNKILTTSGGGALVTADEALATHARKLATQAREPVPHYEHTEVGFNYRMSNVVAGIGRGQLLVLADRVARRRAIFERYVAALSNLPGVTFAPEADWGTHTRWLTCLTIDPDAFGADREAVRLHLESLNIESRPLWKPMHLQPLYHDAPLFGSGAVGRALFERGLCLPSGSSLTDADQDRVIEAFRACQR